MSSSPAPHLSSNGADSAGSRVAITIVTYNSARYIAGCIEHALAQSQAAVTVVVVDNASGDGTVAILQNFEGRANLRIIYNRQNVGFAGGQNQAIAAASEADWILTLNPDVRLGSDFVSALLAAAISPDIGSICGKLLAVSPEFELASRPVLDSTGIYFTPNLRHLDRGNGEPDLGQYSSSEYVIGGTGAACLYRRAMIGDISISGEFFDADFFAYREDADVAWRAQLLGWKCVYTPDAVALHVRSVTPDRRSSLPAVINMHSVKNRWLLRIKNTTPDLYRQFWLPITARDIVVVGGCLLGEWTSLRAFVLTARLFKKTLAKRRAIMQRRRATNDYLAAWFSYRPVSLPLTSHTDFS